MAPHSLDLPGAGAGQNDGVPAVDETLPCPVCRAPVPLALAGTSSCFPFCSERCRLRDLGAWFDGRYVVEGKPVTDLHALEGTDRESP